MILPLALLVSVGAVLFALYALGPRLGQVIGRRIGAYLRNKTLPRRDILVARAKVERKQQNDLQTNTTLDDEWEKIDRSRSGLNPDRRAEHNTVNWDGIIGFLHPFCNAGGGGERVLWAAIRATQDKYPNALCAVYTGDHEVSKEDILKTVKERFNIHLNPAMVTFLYLSTRHYILSSTWPHFTLLGQSLGSIVLGYDTFNLLPPDIFIDTMGYAFTISLCRFLFPDVPTAAYVHYPTISTDMLESLTAEPSTGRGVNAGAGKGIRGHLKRTYWHMFAWLYGWAGGSIDVVMTNSSWTKGHIQQLWGQVRERRGRKNAVEVVFPPVAVEELTQNIDVSRESEKTRQPELLYIAQFRPEKDHQLVLRSFAKFLQAKFPEAVAPVDTSPSASLPQGPETRSKNRLAMPQLTLIGSVRNAADETYIYSLRLLAHELRITPAVTFLLNAPWSDILTHLRRATVGINAMWNEHFGICVVEYQAAGLIGVVHDSGGPRRDIVVDVDSDGSEGGEGPTGIRASDVQGFADGYEEVLCNMSEEQRWRMRLRARRSAKRFSEEEFDERWSKQIERLVQLRLDRISG